MKKIDLGKPTTILNENMNRKDLYVDSSKGDKIKKNIIKQINAINKAFEECDGLLNKMSYKKIFNDEYTKLSVQCGKKCLQQAKVGEKLITTLEDTYKDDVKSFLIQNLDERISYLENVILNNNE